VTDQLAEYFGTKDGALVTGVDDGMPAKAAGLKAGDVITKIDGEAVHNAADVRRIVASKTEVAITITRDHKEQTIKVKY